MVTYIKLGTKSNYITLENELNPSLYDNIGSTYQDYLDGKFVVLAEEQIAFKNENPNASVREVFEMKLRERSVEEIRNSKLFEVERYDSSSDVNQFFYNDQPFWLDKSTRVGLVNSTTILKNAGKEDTTLWLGDFHVTLPCDQVLQMLAALEIYALDCYNVTATHKYNINKLSTIEDIEAYDCTSGYPEKLRF